MKRCKTCKWWLKVSMENFGGCCNEKTKEQVIAEELIGLTTHQDFGCIHYEPRKGKKK